MIFKSYFTIFMKTLHMGVKSEVLVNEEQPF